MTPSKITARDITNTRKVYKQTTDHVYNPADFGERGTRTDKQDDRPIRKHW